ncbi:hypothetical protein PARC_a3915 [Pseudoalteromonas arctica A 37-1-2]|uniref:Uncharacterized protein n=1 Tax=Pseudoalteromonas arctica A 37-1-2 TaxID=1117313 RepID=A0A290S9K7_9GAMM|nr:hypothetical protein PARC_a3915 [Pseudoalteromonas arctica A 37-1-2]
MSKGYQLGYSVLFLTSTKKATTQYGVAFLVSRISLLIKGFNSAFSCK